MYDISLVILHIGPIKWTYYTHFQVYIFIPWLYWDISTLLIIKKPHYLSYTGPKADHQFSSPPLPPSDVPTLFWLVFKRQKGPRFSLMKPESADSTQHADFLNARDAAALRASLIYHLSLSSAGCSLQHRKTSKSAAPVERINVFFWET